MSQIGTVGCSDGSNVVRTLLTFATRYRERIDERRSGSVANRPGRRSPADCKANGAAAFGPGQLDPPRFYVKPCQPVAPGSLILDGDRGGPQLSHQYDEARRRPSMPPGTPLLPFIGYWAT